MDSQEEEAHRGYVKVEGISKPKEMEHRSVKKNTRRELKSSEIKRKNGDRVV